MIDGENWSQISDFIILHKKGGVDEKIPIFIEKIPSAELVNSELSFEAMGGRVLGLIAIRSAFPPEIKATRLGLDIPVSLQNLNSDLWVVKVPWRKSFAEKDDELSLQVVEGGREFNWKVKVDKFPNRN